MFTRITRSGGREYLQLVESYRNDAGAPRQRVIATLGRLDQLQAASLDPLIRGLQRAAGSVAPAPTPESSLPPVSFERALAFGDVFAFNALWIDRGLGDAIRRALRSSRRSFDAEALVRAMVCNRLCAPGSKLGCLEWLEAVSIPGMPEAVTHDQLLRTMDALMDHAESVQMRVAAQLRPMLDQQLSVVFYDLTTIRIHGEGDVANDLRAYGLNKETGGIARQFVLGVVQSAEGLPLMHTVHAGNVSEMKTLKAMLATALKRFPVERVIVVADRGLLSLDNIDELSSITGETERQLQFIRRAGAQVLRRPWMAESSLAVPARRYRELGGTLDALTFEAEHESLAEGQFAGHRLVVAHDPVRAAEQSAKRRKKIAEFEAFADKLVNKLDAQDAGQSERGRKACDRGAYSRFQHAVAEAKLTRFIRADYQAERFSYDLNETAIADAERFDGKLVLLTNVTDFSAEQIVSRYKRLADIERGFRVLESDDAHGCASAASAGCVGADTAPVFHRLPERIRAHALICFLALVLHHVMRMRLRASGSKLSPNAALKASRLVQKIELPIRNQPATRTSRIDATQRSLFTDLQLKPPAENSLL